MDLSITCVFFSSVCVDSQMESLSSDEEGNYYIDFDTNDVVFLVYGISFRMPTFPMGEKTDLNERKRNAK